MPHSFPTRRASDLEVRHGVRMRCAEGGRGTVWFLPPPVRRQPRVGGFAAPDWRVRLATGMKETAAAAGPSREAYFRALLEAAPDGIVITDGEGRIVLVNAQTEHLFGYPRDQLIGQPVEVLVPEAPIGRAHV